MNYYGGDYCNYKPKPILDLSKFTSVCAPNKQVMVYGIASCDYNDILSWLRELKWDGDYKDVFSYLLGQSEQHNKGMLANKEHITSENKVIEKINHSGDLCSKTQCKAGLINMIIENLKRKEEGKPIIPIVFVVEKDNIKLDVGKVLDKVKKAYTDAEIRQAYKLCHDPSVNEKIRKISQESFIFISLSTNTNNELAKFSFTKIASPWESSDWATRWINRRKTENPNPKPYPWRKEIERLTGTINSLEVPPKVSEGENREF